MVAVKKQSIYIGQTFKSFSELEKYVEWYSDEVKQVFVKEKTTPEGPTCKIKKKLKPGIKYHEIYYVCKYGKRTRQTTQHKGKKNSRRKRSRKMNCPAGFRVQATKAGDLLRVSHVKLHHSGHLDSEKDPPPEARRLEGTELTRVKDMLKLRCNRVLLLKNIKKDTGKQLKAKDLTNMMYSMKEKPKDEISAVLDFLKMRGARIDVLKESGHFQGLFFTTPDMVQSVKAWGELIYFDGTYKLLINGLIVILFVVEDGNRLTEVAGVAIVRREDQPTIDWVFNCFKLHHEGVETKNKYFMCDKNATQRNSVRKYFPSSYLLICLLHVLQIFEKKINKLKLDKKTREECLKLLKKIAYAENDDRYNRLYSIMKEKLPEPLMEYFDDNWHNIKYEWSCYGMSPGIFLNRTNNRCESLNQKLKAIIKKLSALLQCVEDLFDWMEFHEKENDRKIALNFNTVLPAFNEVEEKYSKLLMAGPLKLCMEQYRLTEYITFDEVTEKYFLVHRNNRKTTSRKCNCVFWISCKLPCEHIFAVRKELHMDLCDEALCDKRWTKAFFKDQHRLFVESESSEYPVRYTEKCYENMTEKEFQELKLQQAIDDLINIVSLSCGTMFQKRWFFICQLIELWSKRSHFDIGPARKESIEELSEKIETLCLQNAQNNFEKWDVPQKRKNINKLLRNIRNFVQVEPDTIRHKMSILNSVIDAWTSEKNVSIYPDEPGEMLDDSKSRLSTSANIILPKDAKVLGRPKNALVTTNVYKKKKEKKKKD